MGGDTFSHLVAKTNLRVEAISSPMLEQTMRRDDFVSDEEARTGNGPMLEQR